MKTAGHNGYTPVISAMQEAYNRRIRVQAQAKSKLLSPK
jgi:hypothetical protein